MRKPHLIATSPFASDEYYEIIRTFLREYSAKLRCTLLFYFLKMFPYDCQLPYKSLCSYLPTQACDYSHLGNNREREPEEILGRKKSQRSDQPSHGAAVSSVMQVPLQTVHCQFRCPACYSADKIYRVKVASTACFLQLGRSSCIEMVTTYGLIGYTNTHRPSWKGKSYTSLPIFGNFKNPKFLNLGHLITLWRMNFCRDASAFKTPSIK